VMGFQDDIRLTQFLMEFNKSDYKLTMSDPAERGKELVYL